MTSVSWALVGFEVGAITAGWVIGTRFRSTEVVQEPAADSRGGQMVPASREYKCTQSELPRIRREIERKRLEVTADERRRRRLAGEMERAARAPTDATFAGMVDSTLYDDDEILGQVERLLDACHPELEVIGTLCQRVCTPVITGVVDQGFADDSQECAAAWQDLTELYGSAFNNYSSTALCADGSMATVFVFGPVKPEAPRPRDEGQDCLGLTGPECKELRSHDWPADGSFDEPEGPALEFGCNE